MKICNRIMRWVCVLSFMLSWQINATSLTARVNSDNDFSAYISTDDSIAGTLLDERFYPGYYWGETISMATGLTPGVTNYLHIIARDGGWIGGFIGEFSLSDGGFEFLNQSQSLVTGSATGVFGSLSGFGYNDYPLTDLGPLGSWPWYYGGNLGSMNPTARWVWVGNAYDENTIYLTIPIVPADSDGDGVLDEDDICESTGAEEVPTIELKPNRYADIDGDGQFETAPPRGKGKGPQKTFYLSDTFGCNCTQIIEDMGLGNGHKKYGCSKGALEEFIELNQ